MDLRTGRWFDFEIYEGGGIRELMQMVSSAKRSGETPSSKLHWYGEADASIDQKWLVQDLLPETGSGLISGQSSTFKTFDIAAAVMNEKQFLDF